MQKIMLIGPVGVGKTTLVHALNHDCRKAEKTQSVCFCDGAIDTPGEYTQIPRFYSALLVTAMQASVVVLVLDAVDRRITLPPGFSCMFSRKVIGVVTKVDLPEADRDNAMARLRQAGVKEPIFFVSAKTGEGLEELLGYFQKGGATHE